MMFRRESLVYSRGDEQRKKTEAGTLEIDREKQLQNELSNALTNITDRG